MGQKKMTFDYFYYVTLSIKNSILVFYKSIIIIVISSNIRHARRQLKIGIFSCSRYYIYISEQLPGCVENFRRLFIEKISTRFFKMRCWPGEQSTLYTANRTPGQFYLRNRVLNLDSACQTHSTKIWPHRLDIYIYILGGGNFFSNATLRLLHFCLCAKFFYVFFVYVCFNTVIYPAKIRCVIYIRHITIIF